MMHICVSSQARGKSCKTRRWVEGYLAFDEHCNSETPYIGYASYRPQEWVRVDPDTVGRCTGLRDKSGALIFEGDICNDSLGWTFEVLWDKENARFLGRHSKPRGDAYICYVGREPPVEIIGNVHDNPELLVEVAR